MAISPAQARASAKYNKEHSVCVLLRLFKKPDADIIAALEKGETKPKEAKRLIRLAMAIEAEAEAKEKQKETR